MFLGTVAVFFERIFVQFFLVFVFPYRRHFDSSSRRPEGAPAATIPRAEQLASTYPEMNSALPVEEPAEDTDDSDIIDVESEAEDGTDSSSIIDVLSDAEPDTTGDPQLSLKRKPVDNDGSEEQRGQPDGSEEQREQPDKMPALQPPSDAAELQAAPRTEGEASRGLLPSPQLPPTQIQPNAVPAVDSGESEIEDIFPSSDEEEPAKESAGLSMTCKCIKALRQFSLSICCTALGNSYPTFGQLLLTLSHSEVSKGCHGAHVS